MNFCDQQVRMNGNGNGNGSGAGACECDTDAVEYESVTLEFFKEWGPIIAIGLSLLALLKS